MGKNTRRPRPADEVVEIFKRDPQWATAAVEADLQHKVRERARLSESRPILDELRAIGIAVNSVSDMYNNRMDYKTAIPLLVSWLSRTRNPKIKEEIVRALSIRWAKRIAARPLIAEYDALPANQHSLRWAIGNALDVVADDSVADDLIRLAVDRTYGEDRQMVVRALRHVHRDTAVPVLRALLDDNDVKGHAAIALRKLRAHEARADLERLVGCERRWISNEAKKALHAIARSGGVS